MVAKKWSAGTLALCALAGLVCLTACSGISSQPSDAAAAKVVYLRGSGSAAIKGYSAQTAANASPMSTLTFPPNYYTAAVATDSSGGLYVAAALNPVNPLDLGDIFVYPPHSTGQATPSRTINVNTYDVCALAVDANGLLYVAINAGGAGNQSLVVYSSDATGNATPLRTLAVTGLAQILDIAVDEAGNIYVAGYGVNGDGAIAVYSSDASGPAVPARTISFPNSNVYGVAVNTAGEIFASVCRNCVGTSLEIEEFSATANGAATPSRNISIPRGSATRVGNAGPVRLDGAGNIFTSAELSSGVPSKRAIVVFSFAPTAAGDAVPIARITPGDTYAPDFAVQ